MSGSKKKDASVPAYQVLRWRIRQGFDTVKVHFFDGAVHPDSKMRWTCKKYPMHHGTFWLSVNEADEWEKKGLSACACCRALELPAEDDVVDFKTFKEDVAEQRKIQAKADKKQKRFTRRRGNSYGMTRYAL